MVKKGGFSGFDDMAESFKDVKVDASEHSNADAANKQTGNKSTTLCSGAGNSNGTRVSQSSKPVQHNHQYDNSGIPTAAKVIIGFCLMVGLVIFLSSSYSNTSSSNNKVKYTKQAKSTSQSYNNSQNAQRSSYEEFNNYVKQKDALDAETAQLARDINAYQGNIGRNRSFYDRGVDISRRAKQCNKSLENVSCPSNDAKASLKHLFVLINNRAVGMANAIAAASNGKTPAPAFVKGGNAAKKFDEVNSAFRVCK